MRKKPKLGADFDGPDYDQKYDKRRLTGQLLRIFEAMKDSRWHTLDEIHRITGDPPASISAQLRHLRKEKFGAFMVLKRARDDRHKGLFEYQLIDPAPPEQPQPDLFQHEQT